MAMADARLICASSELVDGGLGKRFVLERQGVPTSAFVVRHHGKVYAYLNQCAHMSVELDWIDGQFFDAAGVYLICAAHAATYEPATGFCISGPCIGASLIAVKVEERDDNIYYLREDHHG
jgi:nitrite reductase/ring-hydroxylating ferredoxin subunit